MIGGGKLIITRNAINPFENDSPDNEGVKQFGKLHVECSISSVQPICCLLSMLKWGRSFLVCHFLVLLYFKKNELDIFIVQLVLVLKEEKESEALFQDLEEGTRLGKW